jgi:osmotically-inducible protein OsmY
MRRVQPRRQRVSPWGVAGITGIVLLGAAAVGIGIVMYDRERREAARRRLNDVQSLARDRYAELTGGRTRAEADLEERVRQAISNGGAPPQDLDVVVEGRTVYLRGGVSDPAAVDAAAERIHGVPGVVAVVNLTTSRVGAPQHS